MCGVAVPVALTGSDQAARAGAALLRGYSVRESGGSDAASVRIFDNASAASGTLLAVVGLAAGQALDVMYPVAIHAVNGIYVDVGGTGTVEGSVRIG